MNDLPNSKEMLKESMRNLADSNLHDCIDVLRIDGLDQVTYNLCTDLINASVRYYEDRRDREDNDN